MDQIGLIDPDQRDLYRKLVAFVPSPIFRSRSAAANESDNSGLDLLEDSRDKPPSDKKVLSSLRKTSRDDSIPDGHRDSFDGPKQPLLIDSSYRASLGSFFSQL